MIITPLFILFLGLVFVLLWLFIKTIDKRKWLTFLVALILTPIVYFYVFYPMLNIFSSYHHQKYFSSIDWIEKPALRYEMLNHIVKDNVLKSKRKIETNKLLGDPEWLSWSDSLKAHDNNLWNYNLGIKPGAFNDQQECIEIVFVNDTIAKIKPYQMEISFEEKEQSN